MSLVPGREDHKADPEHLNHGVENWNSLRSNWREIPPGHIPKPRDNLTNDYLVVDIVNGRTNYKGARVPLKSVIRFCVQAWEEESDV